MINTKLIDLLPENISDEAAYQLVIFMMDLALALENHYFNQLRRYDRDSEYEREQEEWR